METDRRWVVVRIDGKIASISTDYRQLAALTRRLAEMSYGKGLDQKKADRDKAKADSGKRKTGIQPRLFGEITAVTLSLEEVWEMRKSVKWDDLMLFGTDFQKRVWRKLWELTHDEIPAEGQENVTGRPAKEGGPRLICYSDFADLCQNRAGVRAVAHAIGLNPVSVIIPCHLVVPKESIDRIREIHKKAEATIFKGDDLCISSILNESSIDFGEYALGKELKRILINLELALA